VREVNSEAAHERARIRALVVLRKNFFRERCQMYEDEGDVDAAHPWRVAEGAMLGLLREIDDGDVAADILRKYPL
jgi:hypothetical protein